MTTRKLVYVAGSISVGDLTANIRRAHTAAMALLKAGFAVITPQSNCFWGNHLTSNPFVGGLVAFVPETNPHGIPHDIWLAASLELVRRCDVLLRLPGESIGADRETECALQTGLKVYWDLAYLIEQEAARPSDPDETETPTFDHKWVAESCANQKQLVTGKMHDVVPDGERWRVTPHE